MMAHGRAFRYGPDALLRQARWELQWLAADAARAQLLLSAAESGLRRAREMVAGVAAELRALYAAPGGFSPAQSALLQRYLDHQRGLASAQERETAMAASRHQQIMAQLQARRITVKAMETHRARKLLEHLSTARGRDLKAADEQWLLTLGAQPVAADTVPAEASEASSWMPR